MSRLFNKGDKRIYSNEEKLQLAELVREFKEEYDAEVLRNKGKIRYDAKRKKHVEINVTKAVRKFYSDLEHVSHNDPFLEKATKLASRCLNDLDYLRDPSSRPPKKTRATGGGRKSKAPKVRDALFSLFVDVRETLKGRLPRRLFKLKAHELYEEWLVQNPIPIEDRLIFGSQWITF